MILKLCSNETRRLRANNGRDRTTVNFIFEVGGRDAVEETGTNLPLCVYLSPRAHNQVNRMKTRMKRRNS